jgi:hypothetical protein
VKVQIDTYFPPEGSFQFLLEMVNKLGNPVVILIILLTVADEDVVFVTVDEAGHVINSY